MNPLGHQLVAELLGCPEPLLRDLEWLERTFLEAVEAAGLSVVRHMAHPFEGQGFTLVAIISESHIGLHTYPEAGALSLDIYTCSDPAKHERLLDALARALRPTHTRVARLTRGNPIALEAANWLVARSELGFDIRYYFDRALARERSAQQELALVENPTFGKMLFLDHQLRLAERDAPLYLEALARPLEALRGQGARLALLGGGHGGALPALLGLSPSELSWAEPDPMVERVVAEHWPGLAQGLGHDPRTRRHPVAALDFLEARPEASLEAVVCDIGPFPEGQSALGRADYFRRLARACHRALVPGGILSLGMGGALDDRALLNQRQALAPFFGPCPARRVFLPSFGQELVFAGLRKLAD